MASLRALLALALLAGIYILALVVVAFGLLVGFGPLIWRQTNAFGTILVAQASIFVVASIWYGLFAVRRSRRESLHSITVSRHDAPALWNTVIQIADEVGARIPTELLLTAVPNAAMSEEARLSGLVPGTRRLYVGLPLLLGLSTDELRAVLCHELGHYSRRHTRFGALVYRGAVSLDRTCERLELFWTFYRGLGYLVIVLKIFSAYASLYGRLSFAVRRRQELEADAAAAAVVGRQVTANALRSAHALPGAWSDFLDRYVEPMWKVTIQVFVG